MLCNLEGITRWTVFSIRAVKNIINREDGKYFGVGTEALYKMAVGNKECNGMSVL